jgi:hypothetical protein
MVILPVAVVSLVPSGMARTAAGAPAPSAPAVLPRFGPVTFEAESPLNKRSGSARMDSYPGASGGQIVHAIGNYGEAAGPGVLRFAVTVPFDGSYGVTLFYAHLNGEPLRTAVISVDDGPSFTVTVAGSALCCASGSVLVSLRAGANAISISNPTGHAPSIDRIVLTAF